ncbi:anti-sigma factor [Oceaniglobus ichthyenteri]|uniref:anti-sigma factor n=1 Tax=Oceaniglobus ichthyenteri TaxID=2136177 RepID=UPI0013DDC6A6|nr:anti-sigma factor [Oceaniglobus ichthyenteri]
MTKLDPEHNDDMLAAEYALHVLSPEDRAAFEARLELEGGLRQRLAFWANHFAGLSSEITPVAPPKSLRRRLAQAVQPITTEPVRLRRFSPMRLFGGGAVALALVVALVVQLPDMRLPTPFEPGYFAGISAQEGALVLNVSYSAQSGDLRVERAAGAAPAGRVLQLWVITGDPPAPVSLGVLPEGTLADLRVPENLQSDLPGATLAISEEPPGGSPIAGPSGEVLGTAALTEA